MKRPTNSAASTSVEIAAQLIANGYAPIPIPRGHKGPRESGWRSKTFTPAEFPDGCNIGIRCGDSGTAFLDVDIYDPIMVEAVVAEWMNRFADRGEWMRRTGQAPKTGFLFRLPEAIKKTEVAVAPTGHAPAGKAEKVEVLCDGQQFIAFGIHPDTGQPYHWHDLDPLNTFLGVQEMLPEISEPELRDFLSWVAKAFGPEKPAQSHSERATAAISAPTVVVQPTHRTGDSAALDVGEAEVRELLDHLDPDMPYGDWLAVLMGLHDLGDHMLWSAVEWSSRGSKFRHGEVEAKWRGFKPDGGVSWATIPAMARQAGADLSAIARKHRGQEAGPAALKPVAKGGFQFVPVADLKYRAPEFIVEDLLESETLGLIFGDPGCGKSFLAVDIALSVATGTPFHGRPTRQGAVFFIAGEGHNGLARRFAAWSKAHAITLDGVPLFKSERAAQFLDGASARAVSDAVAGLAAQHGPPALIIIDTLARNFGAGDENNTRDMSEFVVAVDDLKARFPGCAVLIVHHSGHAEKQRARGAMALKGALDCEFRVEKDGPAMKLVNTKMKDAEPPQDIHFRFEPVELNGEATSAVLEASEPPERRHRLTPTQRLALDTYEKAAADPQCWKDDIFQGLHVEAWRGPFYGRHTADTADGKRKAFQRVRADLVSLGQMTVEDDVYTATDMGVKAAISLQRGMRDIAGHSGTI